MTKQTRKTVVVVGCGFAGSTAVRELARLSRSSVDIIAYDKQPALYNYPVLPRLLNETLPGARVEVPLSELLRHPAVHLRHARVESVDASRRVVYTATGETPYDYLVLATGSRAVPLAQDDGIFVYYPKALHHLRQLTERIRAATAATSEVDGNGDARAHRVAVVGGGLTGVEFAMAIREAADRACRTTGATRDCVRVSLYETADRLHHRGPPRLSETLQREMTASDVRLHLAQQVRRVTRQGLVIGHRTEAVDTVVCCIGSKPVMGMQLVGMDTEPRGIPVDDMLRCRGHDDVFVIGDGMLFGTAGNPRLDLRLAHRAATQGRHTARNIERLLRGMDAKPYRPREMPVGVMLTSRRGVFSYRGLCLTGVLAGRAKRWLELRHT